MQKNAGILVACLVAIALLNGCGGSPGYLAPIIGDWVYESEGNQKWTWEFPNDKIVRFLLDNQKKKWSVTDIRVRGSIIEIDIDSMLGRGADGTPTIKVEVLNEDNIFVSCGLHPGLPFERVR